MAGGEASKKGRKQCDIRGETLGCGLTAPGICSAFVARGIELTFNPASGTSRLGSSFNQVWDWDVEESKPGLIQEVHPGRFKASSVSCTLYTLTYHSRYHRGRPPKLVVCPLVWPRMLLA